MSDKQNGNTHKDTSSEPPLLEVRDLRTYFFTREGTVKAVDGVSFAVQRGEIRGIVGESGCGKSMTALSILRLVDKPGRIVSGEVCFKGEDLLEKSAQEMTKVRGEQISMIFQEPKSSLNPVFRVGTQLVEVLKVHHVAKRKANELRAVELLREVGIPDPERRVSNYPHEMSGGMAQRVMIAMGMALAPDLLIADEPTTALDVTIQAQVLDLIRRLRDEHGMAVMLITHDMGVVAEMADIVTVMYAGTAVEEAATEPLFDEPLHPYTQGLIASIPVMGQIKERLDVIPGNVPNLIDMPPGCRFAPRCRARVEHGLTRCEVEEPHMIEARPGHFVRCWLYEDGGEDNA
ncbi:MAG TPA: ABC transporter ATP-binding protein [Aggregatilinea sp.]|uniref:ABC transporter ATP-binding protein n=1 Tax=Aggregatilinea sp. TaxID=2806333 RepID=UPI002BAE659B|nr:ABC transporter ATP-binding protein [Aggregatilinea sp.]HML21890.1 ABC transporter ATP-binding protein [Aggregatilinea sp.]